MRRKILKGVLWFIIFASIVWIIAYTATMATKGWPSSETPMILFWVIPAIVSGIVLRWMRNREKSDKLKRLKEPYEARLEQWETEGYA